MQLKFKRKPKLSEVLSSLCGITGLILTAGLFLFSLYLYHLAHPDAFAYLPGFFDSCFGQSLLLVITMAFWYYFAAGIRYLCRDLGMGLSEKASATSGVFVLFFTQTMTFLSICAVRAS